MRIRDEQKIELIRQKAMEMIVEDGFDGLSMQKLAKAASVSPATIYIYFKDRDDLIRQISISEVNTMINATFIGFNPQMPFAKGLKIQWENRARYWMDHPQRAKFMEQIRHSPMGAEIFQTVKKEFSSKMREFVHRGMENKEVVKLPIEVYWSIAFAPLYQLIKFHNDGHGLHHEPFTLNKKILHQTLKYVIKALTP
jgi:hypothetical protein